MCGFFVFKQKTAYEMRISDWSSDVCSSDLAKLERSEKIVYRLVLVDASEHRELPGFEREQMVFIDTQAACQPPEVRPATLAQRDKIEEREQGRGDECGEDTQFQSLTGNQKLIILDGERMVGKASHTRRCKLQRIRTEKGEVGRGG